MFIKFLQLWFNYKIFPFPFPLQTFSYTSPDSLLLFTNCYCMDSICICVYVFINITCSVCIMLIVYVFRSDHLGLGIQLVCFFLGKTTSTPSFSQLPIVLWIELRSHKIFCIHSGMFANITLDQLMFRRSCWWDFMGVVSDVTVRHNLPANTPILCLFLLHLLLVLSAYSSSHWVGQSLLLWASPLGYPVPGQGIYRTFEVKAGRGVA